MRKNLSSFGSVTALFLMIISSEKEAPRQHQQPNLPAAEQYYPLSTGNYWVYNLYEIDTSGQENFLGTDTVRVVGDTLINGEIFYNLKNTGWPRMNSLQRDSAGFLIEPEGNIIFAANKKTGVLSSGKFPPTGEDTIFTFSIAMDPGLEQVFTPAGSFNALNKIREYKIWATRPPEIRRLHTYRAADVGIVIEQIGSTQSPIITERRLVDFHIN